MRKYHQFDRKVSYAQRTYDWKKQFYGKEKPDNYDLLVSHYKHAILEALTQVPQHHKELYRDQHFVVTYDTKTKSFQTISLRSAKLHVNTNHKGRLESALSKKEYLKGRLKFWKTKDLENFWTDLQIYTTDLQRCENLCESISIPTLKDILAALLYKVSFLPTNTVVWDVQRKDRSLELKTVDLAHNSWVNSRGGSSLDSFAEWLLQESHDNWLDQVGYSVHESEYGSSWTIDQHHQLKDDIREFITNYTSSSAYFKEKESKLKDAEKKLYTPNDALLQKYGFYVDKRNAWLLLLIIDEILIERNPDYVNTFMPETKSSENRDHIWDDLSIKESNTPNQDEEVPF